MIAVVLALIPLLFSILHGRKKRFVWLAVAAGIIVILVLVLDFGYPRNWYPEGSTGAASQVIEKGAPAGNRVFVFEMTPGTSSERTSQIIPPDETDRSGKQPIPLEPGYGRIILQPCGLPRCI